MTERSPGAQDALRIMRHFEQGPVEEGLAEIARATALDEDSAREAVTALCDEGFLGRGADGTYRLGAMLLVLGHRVEEATGLDEAEELLKQLTVRTGESSSLAVRSGRHVVVLLLAPSRQRLRIEHGVGTRLAVHASAMGKALLAFADREPETLARELGHLERFTGRTITTHAEFVAELSATRAQGFAINREERYEGVVGVAAPVIVPERGTVAAVGVQGPAARLREPDAPSLTRLVERTAQRVAACFATRWPLPDAAHAPDEISPVRT